MRVDSGRPDGGLPVFLERSVSFSSTGQRELVHRRGLSEVCMTDIHRVGGGCCIAGVQWPRLHTSYHPPAQVLRLRIDCGIAAAGYDPHQ